METTYFANGCFWCTEAVFAMLKGVQSVTSGYTGGHVSNPTYEQVSSSNTGHAECLKVEFDPSVITFDDLLTVFFATHDPTTLNRQGNDVGTQYRSGVFYTTPEQKDLAEKYIAELKSDGVAVVTEVAPFEKFYSAEKYHQEYYANNTEQGYCQYVIKPKIEKVQGKFKALLKSQE
jgi:peptide-methionine (S)-S-oxide reductase